VGSGDSGRLVVGRCASAQLGLLPPGTGLVAGRSKTLGVWIGDVGDGKLVAGRSGFPAWEARANAGEIWGISFVTIFRDFDDWEFDALVFGIILYFVCTTLSINASMPPFPA
jgi:hypothetical protein